MKSLFGLKSFGLAGFAPDDEDRRVVAAAEAWKQTKTLAASLHKRLSLATKKTQQAREAWLSVAGQIEEMADRNSTSSTVLLCWVEAERVHADQLFRYLETVEDKFVQATKSICDKQKARVGPCKATYGDAKKKLAKARKASEKNPVLDVADELRMLEAEQEAAASKLCEAMDLASEAVHKDICQAVFTCYRSHLVEATETFKAFEASKSLLYKSASEQRLAEEMFLGCQISSPTDIVHVSGSGGARLLSGNNLDLRSESIKERARGEALQQAFPTSRPQAIHGAATQGVAPAALRSNEMFSTAFDSSQAARQGTNVEGHVAAPMAAAHDDRRRLGERGGPRLPSRPVPPTPMPEPMAAFRPQYQDDDEVSYDDGTHLTLASEAGSQDTSEDDSSLATVNAGPVLDSGLPGRVLDGTATEEDLSSLEVSVEDHPAGGLDLAIAKMGLGGRDGRAAEDESCQGQHHENGGGGAADQDNHGAHEQVFGSAAGAESGLDIEFVSNSSDQVAEDEESEDSEAREGFWDAASRLLEAEAAGMDPMAGGNRNGRWTMYEDDDGNAYYHNSETDETTWHQPPGFVPTHQDPL